MAYILIFCTHVYHGCTGTAVEFSGPESCEAARVQIIAAAQKSGWGAINWSICVPRAKH